MVLSFKPQYPPKILDGTKLHTIRKDIPNRWKVGNKIHFATGVRTKNYKQFFEGECKGIQTIEIYPHSQEIIVDGWALRDEQIEILVKNDGFNSVKDFFLWFDKNFFGKIIHWTDFEY